MTCVLQLDLQTMFLYLSIQNVFLNMLRFMCVVQKLELEWRLGLCTIVLPFDRSRWCSQLCEPAAAGDETKTQLETSGATAPGGLLLISPTG